MAENASFTGSHSLLLEQQLPITLPADPDARRDPRTFQAQLNNGRGGGFVLVDQRVPVEAGRDYNLRFAWRSRGLVREQRGGPHGYAGMAVWIFWGNDQGALGHVWAFRADTDSATWQQLLNPRAGYVPIAGLPYTAPDGATYAQIRLQMVVNTDATPSVWLDQVEFAPTP